MPATRLETVLRGQLSGLTMANDGSDVNNNINIAVGSASDSTGVANIALTSAIVKQLDLTFVAGTGNGGLDTGAKAANATYHVFVIKNPINGLVDGLFSLSATAPTLPSGYTVFRRIGCLTTNGSANIRQFQQVGNNFFYNPGFNFTSASVSTGASTITLTGCPTGHIVTPLFIPTMNTFNNNTCNVVNFASPGLTLATPASYNMSATDSSMTQGFTCAGGSAGEGSADAQNPTMIVSTVPTSNGNLQAITNINATTLNIYMLGWVDTRDQ